jgi:hypothetical protein
MHTLSQGFLRDAGRAVRLDALFERGIVQHAVEVVQALERRHLRPRRVQLVRHTPVDFVPHMFHLGAMAKNGNMHAFSLRFMHSITAWFS